MPDNFWELSGDRIITNEDKAIELIRRCSSASIFKQVVAKIGDIIECARLVQKTRPLSVEGVFKLDERQVSSNHYGIPSKVVKAEINITDERGKFVIGSYFYLIISIEGRIIGLSNVLI